jgi:hypothetical protein
MGLGMGVMGWWSSGSEPAVKLVRSMWAISVLYEKIKKEQKTKK